MISARTKAALQAAKARGVRLGRNAERLASANRATAVDRARQIEHVLAELNRSGMMTRQIAAELTARGITTPRGGRWHPPTVRRVNLGKVVLYLPARLGRHSKDDPTGHVRGQATPHYRLPDAESVSGPRTIWSAKAIAHPSFFVESCDVRCRQMRTFLWDHVSSE
jgi:hypothetical protein